MAEIKPKIPILTTSRLILALLVFITLSVGFLIAELNYGRQVNLGNQQSLIKLVNETSDLIEKQGNISSAQRNALLHQFAEVSEHGGFSTADRQIANYKLLQHINDTLANISKNIQMSAIK